MTFIEKCSHFANENRNVQRSIKTLENIKKRENDGLLDYGNNPHISNIQANDAPARRNRCTMSSFMKKKFNC